MATRTRDQNSHIHGDWNMLCAVCGFKFKAVDMRKRWDGVWVCLDDWETRHPMDYFKMPREDVSAAYANPDPDTSGDTTGTDIGGNPIPPPFAVLAATWDDFETGDTFNHRFLASGAAPADITWTLESGTLPGGTSLSPDGVVSGILTEGVSSFTLRATTSDGRTDTESFTVTVADAWGDLILASGPAFWYKFGRGDDFTNYAITATGVKDAELEPTPPIEGTAQTDTFITATSGPNVVFPGAGDFNGSTSFMYQNRYTDITDLPGTPAAGGHLMIEAVVWLDQYTSGENYCIAAMGPYLHGGGSNRGWRIWVSGNTGHLQYQILGSQQTDHWGVQTQPFPTGQWVHVMINMAVRPPDYPGENFIYINGVSQTVTKVSGNDYATSYGDSPMDLRIGAQREYSGAYTDGEPLWYWDGMISEIIGWQSDNNTDGFSEADMQAHYAATKLGS